jgi:hypothetical protein
MPDAHKNFAYSTITVAPSPATSGTSLTVFTGQGGLFPAPPFNAVVWPTASNPLASNAEIVRVTAIAGDVFTIVRTQESTTARSIILGDNIAASVTAKTLTDVEQAIAGLGDVFGPASSTNEVIAVFDGTTGKLLKVGSKTIAAILLDAAADAATKADAAEADAIAAAAADATTKSNAAQAAAIAAAAADATTKANAAQSAAAADATSKANAAQAAAIAASQPLATVLSNTTAAFTSAQETKLAGIAPGATVNSSDAALLDRANHTGTQSADTITDGATNKAFLATERTKLAGIATGATANSSDAALLNRANHTGTQAAGTITGLAAVATSGLKSDVGLGSVDNTADAAKPVSTAQAAADTAAQSAAIAAAALDATSKANAAQAAAVQRANHTGTQSADTLTDGTTNKVFLATERTKLTALRVITSGTAAPSGGVDGDIYLQYT